MATRVGRVTYYGWPGAVQYRAPAAAAGNGLLNALIAYWPGNEASGNALDAHVNALHLTNVNTVTSNPGVVYALARQYTAASSERHIRAADDALLSAGDVELTIAAWVYLDSKGSIRTIASKGEYAREYGLMYWVGTDRFRFGVRDIANTVTSTIDADALGSPSLAAWYLVAAWHDPTVNSLSIQVNNGVVNTLAAYSGGVRDSTWPFGVGWSEAPFGWFWDGRIGPTMFWKSAAGGGGVLTAAQRTALYNGGLGLPYASFTT